MTDITAEFKKSLSSSLDKKIFDAWFVRINVDVQDGLASIISPTKFLNSWIKQHYQKPVEQAIKSIALDTVRFDYRLRSAPAEVITPIKVWDKAEEIIEEGISNTFEPRIVMNLPVQTLDIVSSDRLASFSNFVVASCNVSAFSTAKLMMEHNSIPSPLYLYGNVGVGKTHLLLAAAKYCTYHGITHRYYTSERFMVEFVNALKIRTIGDFKLELDNVDVLLVDDLQFLKGTILTTEFEHIVDTFLRNGKRIIIAADRPPSNLELGDPRLMSRLSNGSVIEINPLPLDARIQFLYKIVRDYQEVFPRFSILDEAILYLANALDTSARDLVGAMNRVKLIVNAANEPITEEQVRYATRDMITLGSAAPRYLMDEIVNTVRTYFGVTKNQICADRRTKDVVVPRHIAMYICHLLTTKSLPEIGRFLGGKDHTTVLNACGRVEEHISNEDKVYIDAINYCLDKLQVPNEQRIYRKSKTAKRLAKIESAAA